MTCGPYRPIRLKVYKARLENIAPHALVSSAPELKSSFRLDATISGTLSAVKGLRCAITSLGTGAVVKDEQVFLKADEKSISAVICYDDLADLVALWWPVGYGEQHLYKVEVTLLGDVRNRLLILILTRSTVTRMSLFSIILKHVLGSAASSSFKSLWRLEIATERGRPSCLKLMGSGCLWEVR